MPDADHVGHVLQALGVVGQRVRRLAEEGVQVAFRQRGELRLLQTETGDTFAGDWSWVSYGIVAVTLVVGAVLVWAARGARTRSKEKKA